MHLTLSFIFYLNATLCIKQGAGLVCVTAVQDGERPREV